MQCHRFTQNNRAINQIIFDTPVHKQTELASPVPKSAGNISARRLVDLRSQVKLSTRDTFPHRNSLLCLLFFFAEILLTSASISGLARIYLKPIHRTDPFRFERPKENQNRARSTYPRDACTAGEKVNLGEPHSKWQIQRQFTLGRQLLEVDSGRVLRQC